LTSPFSTYPASSYAHPPSLHDALPISSARAVDRGGLVERGRDLADPSDEERHPVPDAHPGADDHDRGEGPSRLDQPGCRWQPERSEEHTSELQSRFDLVCRLLLEKKQQ